MLLYSNVINLLKYYTLITCQWVEDEVMGWDVFSYIPFMHKLKWPSKKEGQLCLRPKCILIGFEIEMSI